MASRIPLTDLAHEAWKAYLRPGAWAIDATAGNGNDTLFLAQMVDEAGHVYAMDIQKQALEQTNANLKKSGLRERVTLIEGDHSKLPDILPKPASSSFDLICFNLGYLPGGDHHLRTSADSTSQALAQSLKLLKPTGALSVIAYRGHPGGLEEAGSVQEFAAALPLPWTCQQYCETGSEKRPGPVWWLFARGSSLIY